MIKYDPRAKKGTEILIRNIIKGCLAEYESKLKDITSRLSILEKEAGIDKLRDEELKTDEHKKDLEK